MNRKEFNRLDEVARDAAREVMESRQYKVGLQPQFAMEEAAKIAVRRVLEEGLSDETDLQDATASTHDQATSSEPLVSTLPTAQEQVIGGESGSTWGSAISEFTCDPALRSLRPLIDKPQDNGSNSTVEVG